MFNLFGNNNSSDDHNERVEEQAEMFENLGYTDIRADHTSEYPDPEKRNGRVPDVTADDPFGRDPVVEIDSGRDTSQRDQNQLNDIDEGLGPDEELFHVDGDDTLFGSW
jgi:hypothetical protein